MVKLFRKYKSIRRMYVELYSLLEVSKYIFLTVHQFMAEPSLHKEDFFVENCKKMKNRLLSEIEEDIDSFSSELKKGIESLQIKKLYDCYILAELYEKAFKEKSKSVKFNPLFIPIFIKNIPVLFLEIFIITFFFSVLILWV